MSTATALDRDLQREVEDALRGIARAFRAVQMYPNNNPTRARVIDDTRQAFRVLFARVSPVGLVVSESALALDGTVVYQDEERGAAGLPWLLYRDGIRRLEVRSGFERNDLEIFLDVLHRCRTMPQDEDDLVTMLWAADLEHVQYRHVELALELESLPESREQGVDTPVASSREPTAAQLQEASMPGSGAPPPFVNIDQYESSLRFLDNREIAHLQEELAREYADDGRPQVISALFDMIEATDELAVRIEATTIIDALVVEALAAAEYDLVALMLREARVTLQRRPDLDPALLDALQSFPARVGDPGVMTQILETIDNGDDAAPIAAILDDLLGELPVAAFAPLLEWLTTANVSPARYAVERAVTRAAARSPSEFAALLQHPSPRVVHGAIVVARSAPSPALVPALTGLLTEGTPAWRVDLVAALAAIGSPRAMQALEGALDDDMRDVRVGALRAIASRRHASALPRLQSTLARKTLRQADLSEKMAFFEAFGALCGDAGVPLLDGLLNGRGLLGPREAPEVRACAAHALGLVGTELAQRTLARALDASDVVVRSAVGRALRAMTDATP